MIEANRPSGNLADLDRAERLLLGFIAQVALVDTDAARALRVHLEPAAFADVVRASIAAAALGLAARGGRIDLVDIVGETVSRGAKPDDVMSELAASIELFDSGRRPDGL